MGVSLTRLVKWIRVICFSSLLLWKRKISSVEKKTVLFKDSSATDECDFKECK
jgi:hypothetical protein